MAIVIKKTKVTSNFWLFQFDIRWLKAEMSFLRN